MKRKVLFWSTAFLSFTVAAAEVPIVFDNTFDKVLKGGGVMANRALCKGKKVSFEKIQDLKTGNCLEVTTPADSAAEFFGGFIPVVKGRTTLRFSIHVKGKGTFELVNYEYTGEKKYLAYTPCRNQKPVVVESNEWIKKDFELPVVSVKDSCKFIRLVFRVRPESKLCFDDFSGTIINP